MFAEPENRTNVKICGITNLEDARFVSGALADFIGFIFFPDSPRYVEPAKAGAIINWLEGPQKVGVFVNQPLDDVQSIATQTGLDYVQLHGNETVEYCSLMDKPVIKAFHIGEDTDADSLRAEIDPYLDTVEYLLFDTKLPGKWGGTGKSFDWKILSDIGEDKPYFLSGGLNEVNIRDAITTVRPFAVDLSSGLEESPGLKDFSKIEDFFEQMRDIWDAQEMGEL
ncbi:phosphoribosylanthranilate isomerase [Rhodohalobacter sp. SW132]|uniref:phosphoribosylanthranilate isomerase n=1 Tax=Rhodohalobacter sp. SW132 TaxID=2293433 RepID=UPI000E21D72D|nr:phosphoribosylanthranilate isomerase [Rhodohalobacter sp. SW132]REL38301.1 phosphoribosylanthranilate isomerase [Rhodohalobacter sp. SW132]